MWQPCELLYTRYLLTYLLTSGPQRRCTKRLVIERGGRSVVYGRRGGNVDDDEVIVHAAAATATNAEQQQHAALNVCF